MTQGALLIQQPLNRSLKGITLRLLYDLDISGLKYNI
jgi:hypothetical protein